MNDRESEKKPESGPKELAHRREAKDVSQTGALVATSAAVALTTVAGNLLLGSGPLAAGVVGALVTLVGGLRPALAADLQQWGRRRYEQWFHGYLADSDTSPETAAEEFVEKLADDNIKAVVADHFRRIQEAIDEEVIPVLGALARSYTMTGAKPDRFFRRATALVQELAGDEAKSLCRMLEALRPKADDRAKVRDEDHVVLWRFPSGDPDAGVERPGDDLGSFPPALELVALLKSHGFAKEQVGGLWGAQTGPHMLVFDRAPCMRLLDVLAEGLRRGRPA